MKTSKEEWSILVSDPSGRL